MRTIIAFAIFVLCSQIGGCSGNDSKLTFSAHSQTSVPKSAKLVHSGGQYAGFDASYGFVFEVSDDALQRQLIKEWNLAPGKTSGGVFKFAKHKWWPPEEELAKMEPSFWRDDKQNEEYWNVWGDQTTGKMYVEHGRW